jgi:uncharacterized repeat protein (TIGR03803 family)
VFKINTNGTGFATLYSFTGATDGETPLAGLVLSGNTLYGTSSGTAGIGSGAVFKINTDGTGFATLYTFTGGNDGAYPEGDLVLSGTTLYGTTSGGGTNYYGTVFKLNISGPSFASLYSFTSGTDGDTPLAGLVMSLSGTTLYGTSSGNNGAVFKINTDGTGFTPLYSFTGGSDGDAPEGELLLSSNTLYGTTSGSSVGDFGTVFKLNTDGTGFTTLYSFTDGNDGAIPYAGLLQSGDALFGTASGGGNMGDGVVFALSLTTPKLNIKTANKSAVLSWNNPAFSLQAAPFVTGVYTNVSGAASPYTNGSAGPQRFFRLISN